ncbi:MAG: hypothetical protein FD141_1498 [Fusobacteria bacterium]|nr:MAG: hypothetical protein FD141_1498 [Fusobacteriota bacterium]KAF0230211.1 MAG: hypothetical protein FD182_601 [Fusobacteriota bacterium]
MIQYILEHEAYIRKLLESTEEQDWDKVRKYHKVQIMFLQHERLVHMMVTLFFGFLMAFSLFMALFLKLPVLLLLVLFIGVLEVFYLVHLYRLETSVQRWYGLYRDITNRLG